MDTRTLQYLLLHCLALTVQGEKCGSFTCLPELNGTCEDGRCKCPGNQIGDASIECADPANNCVCTFHGDPHYITFSNEELVLPLPCAHFITDRIIDGENFSECYLGIIGVASYTKDNNKMAAFGNHVDIFLSTSGFSISVNITRGKDPQKHVLRGQGSEVNISQIRNWTIFESRVCNMVMKYDDANAAFSLLIQSRTPNNGKGTICGKCDNSIDHNRSPMDPFEALRQQLSSLHETNVFYGKNMNNYPVCDDITTASFGCQKSEVALRLCGSLLLRPKLKRCLMGKLKHPLEMVHNFKDCYSATCPAILPCSDFNQFYMDCNTDEVVELQNPDFCTS